MHRRMLRVKTQNIEASFMIIKPSSLALKGRHGVAKGNVAEHGFGSIHSVEAANDLFGY